jgi:hypothetical protein
MTASSFFTAGPVDATGNITGGNLVTSGLVSAGTTITATGNVTGGNLKTSGVTINSTSVSATTISATGNVTGENLKTSGVTIDSTSVSATGNVSAGNLISSGLVSAGTTITATGNITGSNVNTAGQVIATGNITSTGNVSGGNLKTGSIVINSTDITGVTAFTATGNITGGNILSGGLINVTGSMTAGGILTINSSNSATAIVNGGSNAVGNIGSTLKYFNTVYAQATSALYADLAECYLADAEYESGTVLSFGGTAEVTVSSQDHDATVAGVVSTAPAYQMNSGLTGDHVVAVALTGRVPVRVVGPVTPGAMMVSAGNGYARAEKNPAMGTVIGKALQAFNGDVGTIEVVVGRL